MIRNEKQHSFTHRSSRDQLNQERKLDEANSLRQLVYTEQKARDFRSLTYRHNKKRPRVQGRLWLVFQDWHFVLTTWLIDHVFLVGNSLQLLCISFRRWHGAKVGRGSLSVSGCT